MTEALPYTLNLQARPIYPARSLLNLLRMGHCAPTVMQTLLQLPRTQGECGGVTSPLIVLGLPVLFDLGHDYGQRFQVKNAALVEWFAGESGSLQCRGITGCDFASATGAEKYIDHNGMDSCREITDVIAQGVLAILAEMGTGGMVS